MYKSVLITGATGFIGGHLANRLVAEGENVHVIIRPYSDTSLLPKHVKPHINHGNLNDILNKIQPEIVFHLAGQYVNQHRFADITNLINNNVIFTTQLAEAMVGCGTNKLVMASTSWQHFGSTDYVPVNLYAASKQAAETMLRYYVDAKGLQLITLKLFDTYGPNDIRGKLWTTLANQSPNDPPLEMPLGKQLIDLVHIDDVVDAFWTAGKKLKNDIVSVLKDYAVSSGHLKSLREIVELLQQIIQRPISVIWGAKPYRPREVMIPWKGKKLPGWEPKITLEEGFKCLV